MNDRRQGDRRVPPAVAQHAIEERAELLARIEDQAREIERLSGAIHIVFDGPPGPECGRFVEAEDATGRSINAGEWSQRADGYWQLVIRQPSGVVLPERKELDGNGGWRDIASAAHNACLDEVARLNPPPDRVSVLPEPFELRPFQTVDQGCTNYKAGFNAALRKVRERLNSPNGSAGVKLPDDFVCDSKPLQELLNATAMLLETPSQDSATYWTAQLANVEALLKPVSAGVVDERAAFERHFKSVGSLTVNQLAHARDTDGMPFYEHLPTRIAWSAWQARARLNPSPTGSGVVLPDRKMFSEYDPHPEYPSGWNDCLDEVERLNPCRAQAVPEGYVVVPVDPTPEMLDRYPFNVSAATSEPMDKEDLRVVYQAMLAAAPSAQQKESGDE